MSKLQLSDFVHYGRLFELYGKLLSEDRQRIMTSYFEFNMTLVEIAEEKQISRQAVLDAIDKSCKKLQELENSLKIMQKSEKLEEQLTALKAFAEVKNLKEISEKVDKILKEV